MDVGVVNEILYDLVNFWNIMVNISSELRLIWNDTTSLYLYTVTEKPLYLRVARCYELNAQLYLLDKIQKKKKRNISKFFWHQLID